MTIVRGFLAFNRGLLRLPLAVQLWVLWLIILNIVVANYFMPRVEATVIFVSFLVGALAMSALTGYLGFTRILGLGHLPWLPALAFLMSRLPQIDLSTPYGLWIVVLLFSNLIALGFDGYDLWRYWQGSNYRRFSASYLSKSQHWNRNLCENYSSFLSGSGNCYWQGDRAEMGRA